MIQLKYSFFSLLLLLPSPSYAQKVDPQNLRSSCQDAIHGMLLARHDRLHLAEQTLAAYERKERQNKSLLSLRQDELVTVRAERAKSEFNAALQKRNLVLVDEIAKLEQQQKDLQSSILASMKDRDEAKRGYMPLLKDVKALFNIKASQDSLTGQERIYGSSLDYKRQCPKFEFVCKLNSEEAKQLQAIIQHEPDALEACKKYQNQSL